MDELFAFVDEKITEWNKWISKVDELSLSHLKKDAERFGNESESFLHSKRDKPKKDNMEWIVDLATQSHLNGHAYMAYRFYAERLETEFRKKKKERKK